MATANRSPWMQLEEWANRTLSDDSGLCPWWLTPQAETECLVFESPGSQRRVKSYHVIRPAGNRRIRIGTLDRLES